MLNGACRLPRAEYLPAELQDAWDIYCKADNAYQAIQTEFQRMRDREVGRAAEQGLPEPDLSPELARMAKQLGDITMIMERYEQVLGYETVVGLQKRRFAAKRFAALNDHLDDIRSKHGLRWDQFSRDRLEALGMEEQDAVAAKSVFDEMDGLMVWLDER